MYIHRKTWINFKVRGLVDWPIKSRKILCLPVKISIWDLKRVLDNRISSLFWLNLPWAPGQFPQAPARKTPYPVTIKNSNFTQNLLSKQKRKLSDLVRLLEKWPILTQILCTVMTVHSSSRVKMTKGFQTGRRKEIWRNGSGNRAQKTATASTPKTRTTYPTITTQETNISPMERSKM